MNDSIISQLTKNVHFSGNLRQDMTTFLVHHGCPETAGHSATVANEAKQMAVRFGADPHLAEIAGWFHDISAVFPFDRRPQVARQWGIDLLPEEDKLPMIVHQKLSAYMARKIFGVTDADVLSAIGCHTTLKKDASLLDKVVFVADKVKWDQTGQPPYLDEILIALDNSLDAAVFCYLDYLWQQRQTLVVLHPWVVEAHQQIADLLSQNSLTS